MKPRSVHLYLCELVSMEESVRALLAGVDPEANFRAVLEAIYPQVLSFFLRKGVPIEDARELTQDVSLSIHGGISQLRDAKVFRGWVFAIARNAFINYLEKRGAIRRSGELHAVPIDDLAHALPSNSTSALDDMLDHERVQQLRAALAELPRRMQQCVRIRIEEDAPYEVIATRLGISVNTVKAQLFQARQQLGKRLRAGLGEINL